MPDICHEINKLGKGIGNETRYRILELLQKGEKTVGELVVSTKLSQPAISQHLKTLKHSHLVTDERRGQEVYYSLDSEYTLKILRCFVKDLEKCKRKKKTAN
jgi:DNA-binding transcriptional ArsR family regulator